MKIRAVFWNKNNTVSFGRSEKGVSFVSAYSIYPSPLFHHLWLWLNFALVALASCQAADWSADYRVAIFGVALLSINNMLVIPGTGWELWSRKRESSSVSNYRTYFLSFISWAIKREVTRPNFFQPSSCVVVVYQSVCTRTITDRL